MNVTVENRLVFPPWRKDPAQYGIDVNEAFELPDDVTFLSAGDQVLTPEGRGTVVATDVGGYEGDAGFVKALLVRIGENTVRILPGNPITLETLAPPKK